MYISTIKKHDVANGPGVRVSVFVSGCRLNCPGCFNPETHCFSFGKPFSHQDLELILEAMDKPHISGLSILGGDPLEPENQPDVYNIVSAVKEKFPNKTIYLWTGRTLPIKQSQFEFTPWTNLIIKNIDVVIDGPFVEALKDLDLTLRGSSNQRILRADKHEIVVDE